MKQIMDDVWKDISSLPSLHNLTTTDPFQDFFDPAATGGPTIHHPLPWSTPPQRPPLTTMLSLSTSGNSSGHDQEQLQHNNNNTNSNTVAISPHVVEERSSPEQYTEKFKRLMKNRESAARSRARKQARADELEHEVLRLTKENTKLKRLQKELCSASNIQFPKEPKLHRTKSAPF